MLTLTVAAGPDQAGVQLLANSAKQLGSSVVICPGGTRCTEGQHHHVECQ